MAARQCDTSHIKNDIHVNDVVVDDRNESTGTGDHGQGDEAAAAFPVALNLDAVVDSGRESRILQQ